MEARRVKTREAGFSAANSPVPQGGADKPRRFSASIDYRSTHQRAGQNKGAYDADCCRQNVCSTEGSYGSGPPLAKSACIAIKNLWADLDMAG